MSLYLALDQGGHASRAIAFDASGRAVASAQRPIATHHPAPDRVEHHAEEVVASLRQSLRVLAESLAAHRTAISAAGLATQRSSIVCWDRVTGEALSPVISWQDRRAGAALAGLGLEPVDVHQRSGLMVSPHYGASKLRWCLDHLPAVARALAAQRLAFGPLASFLLFRLVDEQPLVTDPANAQRTLLWNLGARDWDAALLARFGIARACLPRCVPTRHGFGTLRVNEHAAPLTICQGDQPAALFADGMPRADCAYVNLGTGAFVQRTFSGPVTHPRLLTSLVWEQGDQRVYVLEGTVNGAGAALEWLAASHGTDALTGELALWLAADGEPPLFLNGIGGLGAPYWVADFPSRFVGEGTIAQQAVAVAESILFLLRVNLEALASAGVPLERIAMTGGLSQLDGLCQRLADLSGIPVWRPVEHEATARGLACLVAGMPRTWEAAGGAAFAPRANARLADRYTRWRRAMDEELART